MLEWTTLSLSEVVIKHTNLSVGSGHGFDGCNRERALNKQGNPGCSIQDEEEWTHNAVEFQGSFDRLIAG
jgi:hypothetical protein